MTAGASELPQFKSTLCLGFALYASVIRTPRTASYRSDWRRTERTSFVLKLTAAIFSGEYLQGMIGVVENANIRPRETTAQFSARAESLLADAKALSEEISGNLIELNRWMAIASRTMTWMEALYFSITCMRQRQNGGILPEAQV